LAPRIKAFEGSSRKTVLLEAMERLQANKHPEFLHTEIYASQAILIRLDSLLHPLGMTDFA
jgi:hypothetical protein